jgi:hypothetical protein
MCVPTIISDGTPIFCLCVFVYVNEWVFHRNLLFKCRIKQAKNNKLLSDLIAMTLTGNSDVSETLFTTLIVYMKKWQLLFPEKPLIL